jgi:NAD(P)H-dependent flavin oxidoreductase YrpB (nitropropane dioxygenase family)
MSARLRTRICDLFGVEVPIVQTGMGWVAGARLVAATAEAGGLGILAAATMRLDELEAAIHKVKARTDRPFGVNLRADQEDIEARVNLLIREGVRVASFARAPGPEAIRRFKDAGILTMPTVGAVRHAEKVAAWGVDAIIAQGGEGGGHTGSVPTSLLLPAVCRAVDVPVIGAGGFYDGRGLVAALSYGAEGIAMGTRFLLTRESTVPDAVKQAYLDTPITGTVVTTAVDGFPQRVVRTALIDSLERQGPLARLLTAWRSARALATDSSWFALIREGLAMRRDAELPLAELIMAANAPMLTKAALVEGRLDAGVLPTGQVVGEIDELPTVRELIDRIMDEAEATLDRLATLHPREPR